MKTKRLPAQRNEAGGFTLVELLTVVAVIGVLAAALLPVLGRAKAQSQSTVCKNHLNQTGHAMTMYLSDNNRYPSTLGDDGAGFQTWADRLNPYNPINWTNTSWHCPTYIANKGLVEFQKPPPGGGEMVCRTSYSYNALGISGLGAPRITGPRLGLGFFPRSTPRDQQVLAPAETYAVADARPSWDQNAAGFGGREWMNPYRLFPAGFAYTEAAPPHSQGYNMLFCDAHVAQVKRKDYLFPPRSAHDWNRDNQPHPELWAPASQWEVQN